MLKGRSSGQSFGSWETCVSECELHGRAAHRLLLCITIDFLMYRKWSYCWYSYYRNTLPNKGPSKDVEFPIAPDTNVDTIF